MPQAQLFRLEAEVRCADGDCGKLRTLVIRRGDDAVTHLVVEPAHGEAFGRIVPLALVDTGGAGTADADRGDVRLRCTRDEFEQLDPAEATYFPGDEDYGNYSDGWEPAVAWPYYATTGPLVPGAPGTPGVPGTITGPVTVGTVPDELPGEDEVFRGDHVHATDGDIGHVLGFVVEGRQRPRDLGAAARGAPAWPKDNVHPAVRCGGGRPGRIPPEHHQETGAAPAVRRRRAPAGRLTGRSRSRPARAARRRRRRDRTGRGGRAVRAGRNGSAPRCR